LSTLIDAISALTVVVPVGTSSIPVNVASFIKLKAQLNTILSRYNSTI